MKFHFRSVWESAARLFTIRFSKSWIRPFFKMLAHTFFLTSKHELSEKVTCKAEMCWNYLAEKLQSRRISSGRSLNRAGFCQEETANRIWLCLAGCAGFFQADFSVLCDLVVPSRWNLARFRDLFLSKPDAIESFSAIISAVRHLVCRGVV